MGENGGTSKSRVSPHIRLGCVKLIGCVRLQVEVQRSIRVVGYIVIRNARYLENRISGISLGYKRKEALTLLLKAFQMK